MRSAEDLFCELAIEDLQRAADLFLPIHEQTGGVDGWVSVEVSSLRAYDTALPWRRRRPCTRGPGRLKIPGTRGGLPAITEAVAAGIPVNVTPLFSADHYLAAADAYLKGAERRIADGLDPGRGLRRLCLHVALGHGGGQAGTGGSSPKFPLMSL